MSYDKNRTKYNKSDCSLISYFVPWEQVALWIANRRTREEEMKILKSYHFSTNPK
jgi:hypothetical protein